MRTYLGTFYSPPKGGNGRGVPTFNRMAVHTPSRTVQANPTGPSPGDFLGSTRTPYLGPTPGPNAMSPILRGNFDNGVASARLGVVEARHAGASDFRNFSPGMKPAQVPSDPSPISAYDYELRRSPPPQTYSPQTVTPVLEPDTKTSYRIDGKPNQTMPR